MDENEIYKVAAFYEQDSKRFHRFLIDNNEWGIVGHVYVPKGADPMPAKVEVSIEGSPPKKGEEK